MDKGEGWDELVKILIMKEGTKEFLKQLNSIDLRRDLPQDLLTQARQQIHPRQDAPPYRFAELSPSTACSPSTVINPPHHAPWSHLSS